MKVMLFFIFAFVGKNCYAQTTFQYDATGCIVSIKSKSTNSCNPVLQNQNTVAGDVKIYPNPTNSILYAQTSTLDIFIIGVTVYDAAGKLVLLGKYNKNNFVQVDVSQLASATYFINFETETGHVALKFIKSQ